MIPYAAAWRLNGSPFDPEPKPEFFIPLTAQAEGLTRLQFIVDHRRSGAALLAPAGTGKSMLLHVLATRIEAPDRIVVALPGAPGQVTTAARLLATALGGVAVENTGLDQALDALAGAAKTSRHSHLVALVDNADLARDNAVLDVFRMAAAALEQAGKSCTILLAGPERLADRLGEIDPIAQRMHLIWWLQPFTLDQTSHYVRQRLTRVGRRDDVFTEAALYILQEVSGGIARNINHLADLALLEGALARVPRIDRETMLRAVASHRPAGRDRRDTAAADQPEAPPTPQTPPAAPADEGYVWE